MLLNRKRGKLTKIFFSVCCQSGQESQWGLIELLEVIEFVDTKVGGKVKSVRALKSVSSVASMDD